jgi:hypothetical protein
MSTSDDEEDMTKKSNKQMWPVIVSDHRSFFMKAEEK